MSLKCSNRRYRHRYNLIGFLQQFRQPSLCHKPGLSRDGKRKEHGAKGKNRDFSLHGFSLPRSTCYSPLFSLDDLNPPDKGTDWQIFSPMCRGVFYSLGRALTFVAAGGYYGHMKKASVSDLKNQISRYLDYVKHGETVLVLDRMVPVAELKPVTGKSSSGKLVALERKGIIRLGSGEIPEKFFKGKLSGKRARILDALLEERENGR
jgi:antitoxin (DNA-binding transcriptional repressor) of toxin-antitoxin stability system